MNEAKLKYDLGTVLPGLQQQGAIRGYDYSLDMRDPWVIIKGAFRLPKERFNLPDCNVKLPIPYKLYEQAGPNRLNYYDLIFIDESLRMRGPGGAWVMIPRQIPSMYTHETAKGWSFLCVYPKPIRPETDIRAVFPIVQKFLFRPR
jgi:hypothetical protein